MALCILLEALSTLSKVWKALFLRSFCELRHFSKRSFVFFSDTVQHPHHPSRCSRKEGSPLVRMYQHRLGSGSTDSNISSCTRVLPSVQSKRSKLRSSVVQLTETESRSGGSPCTRSDSLLGSTCLSLDDECLQDCNAKKSLYGLVSTGAHILNV